MKKRFILPLLLTPLLLTSCSTLFEEIFNSSSSNQPNSGQTNENGEPSFLFVSIVENDEKEVKLSGENVNYSIAPGVPFKLKFYFNNPNVYQITSLQLNEDKVDVTPASYDCFIYSTAADLHEKIENININEIYYNDTHEIKRVEHEVGLPLANFKYEVKKKRIPEVQNFTYVSSYDSISVAFDYEDLDDVTNALKVFIKEDDKEEALVDPKFENGKYEAKFSNLQQDKQYTIGVKSRFTLSLLDVRTVVLHEQLANTKTAVRIGEITSGTHSLLIHLDVLSSDVTFKSASAFKNKEHIPSLSKINIVDKTILIKNLPELSNIDVNLYFGIKGAHDIELHVSGITGQVNKPEMSIQINKLTSNSVEAELIYSIPNNYTGSSVELKLYKGNLSTPLVTSNIATIEYYDLHPNIQYRIVATITAFVDDNVFLDTFTVEKVFIPEQSYEPSVEIYNIVATATTFDFDISCQNGILFQLIVREVKPVDYYIRNFGGKGETLPSHIHLDGLRPDTEYFMTYYATDLSPEKNEYNESLHFFTEAQ